MMSTATAARPSTRDLAAFISSIDEGCDPAIRAAVALIAAHRSAYAIAGKLSAMRRLAREAVYAAVSGADAHEAKVRLDRAITHETDPTGAFRTALWPLLASMTEVVERDRRDYRAHQRRLAGDISHLPAADQAYIRELRASFRVGAP